MPFQHHNVVIPHCINPMAVAIPTIPPPTTTASCVLSLSSGILKLAGESDRPSLGVPVLTEASYIAGCTLKQKIRREVVKC